MLKIFFVWMLHGSTRFVVRAVALLSAQKKEVLYFLYILYRGMATVRLPESAVSGVG